MSVDLIVGIVAAVAVITAALIAAPRLIRDPVVSLQKLVEIYNALPDTTPAKAGVLERIEQQVSQLDSQDSARRNPPGVALGIMLMLLAAACAWLIFSVGGLWWILIGPLGLLLLIMGIIGLYQGAAVVPRAANGQWLSYQADRAKKLAAKNASKP